MARRAFRGLLSVALSAILLPACTKTVFVRVPGICPRDSYCLAGSADSATDAKTREAEFVRRAIASTVDIRVTRFVPNMGRRDHVFVGALIGSRGYVLTSFAHLDGAESISVTLRETAPDGSYAPGREMSAMPLIVDIRADVALLALRKEEVLPQSFPVRWEPLIATDRVWFVGRDALLRTGIVTETGVKDRSVSDYADVSIVALPEEAGAPVLNACGEMVGIATGPYGKNGMLRLMPVDLALTSLHVTRTDLR